MSVKRILVGLLLSVLLSLISACGESPPEESSVPAVAAPEFDLERIGGGRVVLKELRGKVVVIDFWDTWCPPCKAAMPHLQALSVAYKDDVVVVGVAMGRDGRAAVTKFVAEYGLTFPIAMIDPDYKMANDYGPVQSIPTTVIVDREGNLRHTWVGGQTAQEYERILKQVLGG